MREGQGEQNTVSKILAAATLLFAQKGFSGVSVKEIAEAAGVNIASISYHFGGKEKLYVEVLDRQFEVIYRLMQLMDDMKLTAIEAIRQFANFSRQVYEECPCFNRLMLSENVNPNLFYAEQMAEHAQKFRKHMWEILKRGVADGELRADFDTRVASLALVSLTQYYFNDRDLANVFLEDGSGQDQSERYLREAIELFLRSVVK
ncbi:TetR/AcrR family transcriptional regulator [Azotosporobacter soli]|uniref:TetR/AcrR family transcriptional regulator n=1 Tax=Azotosporobacter soli TaxID=3055040 RepID=UPI0031FE6D94